MKTKLILVSLLALLCAKGFAQDVIHTQDGTIQAKVVEITDDTVRYKTFDNLEGPDYSIPVGRVVRIVFENGTEKVFTVSDYYGPLAYHWGSFYDKRGRLYSDQVRDYLGVTLYGSRYRKARNQFQWGTGLTVGGATMLLGALAGSGMYTYFNNKWGTRTTQATNLDTGETGQTYNPMPGLIIVGAVGAAFIGAGIPLWISGDRKLNDLADDYNRQYGPSHAASLQIGPTSGGLGLALRF